MEIQGHRYLATLALITANDDEARAQQISYSLVYNVATTAGTAATAAALALLIRRRLRAARVAAHCLAVVTVLAFGCGLASGPDIYGLRAPLPPWYPSVQTLLVVGVLAAMVALVVLLTREPADEFYRPGRETEDPEWTAFIQRRAGGAGADGPR